MCGAEERKYLRKPGKGYSFVQVVGEAQGGYLKYGLRGHWPELS